VTSSLVARKDPSLSATVVSRFPLRGVRAASGLAWFRGALAVIQDDAPAIAVVDPTSGAIRESIRLPEGGTDKPTKLDLEACVCDGDTLVAFGSGSTSARERIAVVRPGSADVVHAPSFYASLRESDFAGSELNLEGAVLLPGGVLRLFNRGNGASPDGRLPVDATCDLPWPGLLGRLADPPRPANVVHWDLGALAGTRLSFTDAALAGDAILFLAAAEASPDTYRDGPVAGSALGRLDGSTGRWTPLRDTDGRLLIEKAEGLALDPSHPHRAFVVVDKDDASSPAELCVIDLAGGWPDSHS